MGEDELYGLALDRFIAERDALVRTLRADGDREQAGQVAGLRKPSVAAWAVNQLVRTQGELLAELFAAGDALRAAQGELLAVRGDGRALRAAAERKRSALLRLTSAARRTLSREGDELSGPVVERVGETLHAAAVDEWARAQVSAGRLERELRQTALALRASSHGPLAAHPGPESLRATATRDRAGRTAPSRPSKKLQLGRSCRRPSASGKRQPDGTGGAQRGPAPCRARVPEAGAGREALRAGRRGAHECRAGPRRRARRG